MKILIIEDNSDTAQSIRDGLSAEMHTSDIATDGTEGSFLARSYKYDMIILDYSLPKKDGLVVCKEIRNAGNMVPIIFLSVNDDTDLKISALDAGADDYLSKPFSFAELYARICAISRRNTETSHPTIKVGDLILDTIARQIKKSGKCIQLTRKEFNILEYLMRNHDSVISRALIMEQVWTADTDPFSNTVEVHIRNIRRKIRSRNRPDMISNFPGRGYMISAS